MTGAILLALLWAFVASAVWLVTAYARVSLWVMVRIENAVRKRRLKREPPPD